MSGPSWRQLAAIPESTLKAQILRALDITPQPEGISNTFHDRGLYVRYVAAQDSISYWIVSRPGTENEPLTSALYLDGSDALKACRCPAGIPMGDALRSFFRAHGWLPLAERQQPAPNANTRTII